MRKLYFLVLGLLFISGVKAQIVNIPDENFRMMLLMNDTNVAKDLSGNELIIDANNDGQIQVIEAQNVSVLRISFWGVASLEGISSFSNLKFLNCSNNTLKSLDVTPLVNLIELNCSNNQLSSVNVSGLSNLVNLDCSNNKLDTLNVLGLINLNYFNCGYNQLKSIDVSDNINLGSILFNNNLLSSLDFSKNSNGFLFLNFYNDPFRSTSFNVSNNQLTSIIFPKLFKNGVSMDISNNLLETIQFPGFYYFAGSDGLILKNNPNVTSVLLKNIDYGLEFTSPFFEALCEQVLRDLPNLRYLCVPDYYLSIAENVIQSNSYNCLVNSYCSFLPGIEYYTIQGNAKLDKNNNGCDALDMNYPNLKIAITDGTNTGSLISDTTGNYFIPVTAGTQTITPVLENLPYFTVSPTSVEVTFPDQISPFIQDFCITPNGIHPDLEVTLMPIDRARPGFDASYNIIYKNKGNQVQSGSVNLTFDDVVLDLVTANPVVTTQSTDNLSWNYADLQPFETREIQLTLNVNSPMETPPVNNDDRLSFTASIDPITGDEQPVDNSFALRQVVVGSFDPNDKTCLEGATIPPSAVGKYVHYLIRFENKGTAEAQNVVVKDMIDTEKFDISSLEVTQGSHSFVTRITETNKVEFIFENINLPFDDATNDGYVAFKIKTNPSLVVGDSFSNTASIYFDYNFPIVTNTATTSVLQSLGTNDFEFDSYFSIYPNPAKNSLNMDTKKQIKVSSISIYNTLGQQILVIPNAQYTKQVDISNLKTGNYFIKLTSDKGSTIGKFIKS